MTLVYFQSLGAASLTDIDESLRAEYGPAPALVKPFATKSVQNFSKVIGWPEGRVPIAPDGFVVTRFAEKLISPRNIYIAPNGDIFVSEANTEKTGAERIELEASGYADAERITRSANRITLLRDTNHDGIPESRSLFLSGLNQPFGMLIVGNFFYVANTDGIWRYPYTVGDTAIKKNGQKILDLPGRGYNNHWTRNIIASRDHKKIYVSVGSSSNVADHGMKYENRRANILEINPDGSGERIYANGLRNPVGMSWAPGTQTLWTSVNERDEMGDQLVPDYLTSVRDGGFYGWPYSYYGQNLDPRVKDQKPELVRKAIVPDFAVGAHTASLGLAFYEGKSFPAKYRQGAFVGQHGSWNRSQFVGYKVLFVPFVDGKPSTDIEDFLTGFIGDSNNGEVYGRPVNLAVTPDGSLLVADDAGGIVWRVSAR